MPRPLRELRPCDSCSKPIGATFYVLRTSIAVVNRQAVEQYLGMRQFFGGRAADALVDVNRLHDCDGRKRIQSAHNGAVYLPRVPDGADRSADVDRKSQRT